MWIYTKHGFISVVRHTEELVVVRARRFEHLKALFPLNDDIWWSPSSDYKYRLYLYQRDFVHFMVDLAGDIDYANFKGALPFNEEVEKDYTTTCTDVWLATFRGLHEGA